MTPASQTLLRIEGLTIDLPPGADRPHAVQDVSFHLDQDEILCIVGESGSGKSMVSRAILGLFASRQIKVGAGRIDFKGEDLLGVSDARLRALRTRHIAMVFQEPMTALNPVMKIGQQILEVLDVHADGDPGGRRQRVLDVLDAVHLPDPARIFDAYPHQLSGGQRQRAMIAMALVLEPEVLIADEPTTALDVTTQAQILALVREIQRKRRMGVLFITHDFGVVADIADRIVVMQRGQVVEQGAAREVLGAPRADYTRTLLAAVPGLHPVSSAQAASPAAQPEVLRVSGLCKTYGTPGLLPRRGARRVHALNDVSLSIRRGETLGIVGESGSGKSTLARCITRLVDPDAGEILLNDVDITTLGQRALRSARRRMQMVFQDPYGSLNPRKTVGSLVAEGPIVHGTAPAQAWSRARELLELVGLDARALDRFPHEFSGGQRQRIGLARALALEPDILVLDEPVSALDVLVQEQVLQLLADVRRRLGLTVLFITHDLRVACQVCDRIAVMRRGEIVESGPVAQVFSQPAHGYTRELLAAVPGRGQAFGREAGVA